MSSAMPKPEPRFFLSPEETEQFHRNGYIGPFTLYSPDEMRAQWRKTRLQLLDRSYAAYQPDEAVSGSTNISNYDRHLDDPFLADHICRHEIVDRVASILGPDVICWRTEFFPKHPGDEGTDWHQADTFANASGKPQILWPDDAEFGGTITVWSAFTEASIGNDLATRNLLTELRDTGQIRGGGRPFGKQDRSRFLGALDNAIQAIRRTGR